MAGERKRETETKKEKERERENERERERERLSWKASLSQENILTWSLTKNKKIDNLQNVHIFVMNVMYVERLMLIYTKREYLLFLSV